MPKENQEHIGKYTLTDLPLSRIPTIDVLEMGIRSHHVTALLEIDVTKARESIRAYKSQTGNRISFTAWIILCISKAMEAHRHINSFISLRKRKLITFEDIDITVLIEKEIDGEKAPLPYVIRKTHEKTLETISQEIYDAMAREVDPGGDLNSRKTARLAPILFRLPQAIRMLFWKKIMRDPFFAKQTMGTAAVTSIGMMGTVNGYIIPNTIFTSCYALGSIAKKPAVIDDQIKIREYLYMTVVFDHDVIDGGPAARFVGHLVSLIENAYGLVV